MESKLSSLLPGSQGKTSPSPSLVVSRGFHRRQAACFLGALGTAARPRPSACALAPGLAGGCRGEGWLVAGPGRAPRNADKDPGHGLGNH